MKYAYLLLLPGLLCACNSKYDKTAWVANANQHSDNPRYDMIDDLKQHYLLKGASTTQVLDLLNKAEEIDTSELGIHWAYPVGGNPGFHTDPCYLIVDFDYTGHLTGTRIIER